MTQPDPIPNSSRPIWELVIQDMHSRDQTEQQRYGTRLQANNGRDALRDAYEEALGLCVYLRQAIEERRQKVAADADAQRTETFAAFRREISLNCT